MVEELLTSERRFSGLFTGGSGRARWVGLFFEVRANPDGES